MPGVQRARSGAESGGERVKPLLQFFDAGHYECDVDDCTCPFASFTYEIGSYPDGSEVVLLIFECQWGHTSAALPQPA